jgi:hypothetical protein
MSSENCTSSLIEPRFLVLTGLVIVAALARTIDHGIPNFAPIGAIALFGGACFGSKKLAFLVPVFALLLSDVILNAGRHQNLAAEAWMLTAFTYGAFAVVVCLGFGFRNRNRTVAGVFVGSLAASAVFFAISNFGWWAVLNFGSMGLPAKPLVVCYVDAIPFFHYTVLSDVFFNTVLFGSLALAESRFAVLRSAQAA